MVRHRNCGYVRNSANPSLEEVAVFDPEIDPVLARRVNWILEATEKSYNLLVSCKKEHDRYFDREKRLPAGENCRYIALLVNENSNPRRMIINEITKDIFVSPDHYRSIYYAGRPNFVEASQQ
jgi:hypothetical protein